MSERENLPSNTPSKAADCLSVYEKLEFNKWVRKAKQREKEGDIKSALKFYGAAARIFPQYSKLQQKIKYLELSLSRQNTQPEAPLSNEMDESPAKNKASPKKERKSMRVSPNLSSSTSSQSSVSPNSFTTTTTATTANASSANASSHSSEEPLIIDGVTLDFNKANISEKAVISKIQNNETSKRTSPNNQTVNCLSSDPDSASTSGPTTNTLVNFVPIEGGWFKNKGTGECVLDWKGDDSPKFCISEKTYENLLPHQRDGIVWLWGLFKASKGGVLGDDMGLGKSVQISAFLSGLFKLYPKMKCLIVAPLSLLEEPWEKELNTWAPKVRRKHYKGSSRKQREIALDYITQYGGVLLTTYGMVRENIEQFAMYQWDVLVLDEAHTIKKHTNKIYQALLQLKATRKFLLTATPIMNNLTELWALYNFTHDGQLLGQIQTFHAEFGSSKNANDVQRKLAATLTYKLRSLIKPYFLRREKKDVFGLNGTSPDTDADAANSKRQSLTDSNDSSKDADTSRKSTQTKTSPLSPSVFTSAAKTSTNTVNKSTPHTEGLNATSENVIEKLTIKVRKNDYVVWIKLTPIQIELYAKFITIPEIKEILNKTRSPLAALSVLKKICNHPTLLRTEIEYREQINQHLIELQTRLSSTSTIAQSSKLMFAMELLEELRRNSHRVLIFSHSTKMLDIIQEVLCEKNYKWLRIDGEVKPSERQETINTFNRDPTYSVFLLSTQVGGYGLNLTAADRVVIFDPAWNVADDQAVDRAYRIGQNKNVIVYRLLTCGTIEEKIYRKQLFKGDLMKTMTQRKQADPKRLFSEAELKIELSDMFEFDNPNVSSTQLILEAFLQSQKRHGENIRLSLQQHRDFVLSLPMVFGLSNHDLIYNAQKLREFEVEYNRKNASTIQTESKQHTSPSEKSNIETIEIHETQIPADRRESALFLQDTPQFIVDRAERSVQKMAKTILPPKVIEHQRQQLQQQYSAQKGMKYVKKRLVLDLETNEPFLTPATNRKLEAINSDKVSEKRKSNSNDINRSHENDLNLTSLSNDNKDTSSRRRVETKTHMVIDSDNDENENVNDNTDSLRKGDSDTTSTADQHLVSQMAALCLETNERNATAPTLSISNVGINLTSTPKSEGIKNEISNLEDLTPPSTTPPVEYLKKEMEPIPMNVPQNQIEKSVDSAVQEEKCTSLQLFSPLVQIINETILQNSNEKKESNISEDNNIINNNKDNDVEKNAKNPTNKNFDAHSEIINNNKNKENETNEKREKSNENEATIEKATRAENTKSDTCCTFRNDEKESNRLDSTQQITEDSEVKHKDRESTAFLYDMELQEFLLRQFSTHPEPESESNDEEEDKEIESNVEQHGEELITSTSIVTDKIQQNFVSGNENEYEYAKNETLKEQKLSKSTLTTRDNEPTTETSPNASTHRQPNVPVDDHKESPPSEDKADTSKRNNEHEMEDRNNSQAIAIEKSNVEIESSSSSSSSSSTDNETEDNEEGSSTDNNENEGVDRTIASDEGFSETNNNSNDNHKEHTPDNEENESDTFQNNGTSMTSERNTDKPTEQITSVSKTATPQCTNDLPPCDSELEIVMSSESPPRKLTRLKQNSEFPNSTSFNSNGASHNVSYAKQDNATTVASCKDSEDDILSFDCFASNMQSFSPMKQKRGSNHRSAVKMYSSGDEHPSTTPSCPQESQPTTQQQGQSQISMQFPNTENRKYFIRHRKEIAQKLYDEFNARIFEGRLPALELVWSNAMTNASGKYCSEIGERGKRISYLKLSSKFLTTYERLRKTLSHEMCHAATHLIDNELSDIHGPIWYKWAQLTETLYPDLKVSRCHTYHVEEEFVFKYQYACDNPFCDAIIGKVKKLTKAERLCTKCTTGTLMLVE